MVEGWEEKKLGEILVTPPSYGINEPACDFATGLSKYIRITDITENGKYQPDEHCYVKCSNTEQYKLRENDIVLARTGASVGKSYLYSKVDGELIYAGFLIKVSVDKSKADSRYIYECLHTKPYWDWVKMSSARSGQPGINGQQYASYEFILPPLPEQRLIATALSDMDAYITALEKLIAKKRIVKQGAMQELLTGKGRLPGFSGEWVEKKLGDIGEVGRGWVISNETIAKSLSNKYPVYSSQTANKGIMGYLDTYDFDGEYITWTTDGVNAGTVFYRNGKFNCTNVCGTIKLKSIEHNLYFVALRLQNETFSYVSTNLANPKLMNDVMKTITITLPPTLTEQTAIAAVLSDMDAEIDALTAKLNKAKRIKQGMMSELLTGRIRLI
jgi:type I restriction enzyme S subunit